MIIETQFLCKKYGEKTAVKSISISVKDGEIFGFLGPNGAGKSTFIKMLTGLVFPTSGTGSVLGFPLGKVEARLKMGYLPELFKYQDWMTGSDLLDFHGSLYKLKKDVERNKRLLSKVGLTGHENYKLSTYSKGMQQRLGLAAALIPDPQLLFLDEPTSALDPIGRKEVRDIILSLKKEGRTIFLNSHLLSEVEAISDSITIVNKGLVVKSGSTSDLLNAKTILTIKASNLLQETVLLLQDKFESQVTLMEEGISVSIASKELIPEINAFLVSQGVYIYELKSQSETLEDVFLKAVAEETI